MVADARFPETFSSFAVEAVGTMPGERQSRRAYERAQDSAQCSITEDGQLQFTGTLMGWIAAGWWARWTAFLYIALLLAVLCDAFDCDLSTAIDCGQNAHKRKGVCCSVGRSAGSP